MARNFICTLDYPIAAMADGKVKGFELDGVLHFQGIPYARAKRFHPAEPIEKWDGVKDATSYGPIAPAYGDSAYGSSVPQGELLMSQRFWPQNECCQNLNVWTKTMDKNAKKPVMVWLHGGGFSDGSALELESYDGAALCEHGDVVVVSINHRLHLLGYLDLSAFGEQYCNSANAGISDLVEALKWVQRNVDAFGGDPNNITIFGQSGGGGKVYTLMQTPAAAGLFHKCIIMSGTDNFDRNMDHTPIVREMLKNLSISADEVEKLETFPYSALMKAYCKAARTVGAAINWGPIANDYYVGHPVDVGFTDYAKTVPLIVGTVIAEFGGFRGGISIASTEAEKRAAVEDAFNGHADEIIPLFTEAYPNTDLSVLPKLDTWVRPGATAFLDTFVTGKAKAPAYLYQFALVFDVNGGTPAWHCSDIPFLFHNCHRVPCANIEEVTDRLESEMFGAVAAFAHTENPNHDKMVQWLPYTVENKETMVFDRKTALRTNQYDSFLLKKVRDCLPKNTGSFVMPLPVEDEYTK